MGQHPKFAEQRPDFRLLLSHTPDYFGWAREQKVDLMLAGHNHGGQIVLPVVGPVFAPSRYGVRYASGAFWSEPTLLYVSRGLGGRHPIRLNCPPELTRIVLEPQAGPSRVEQPPAGTAPMGRRLTLVVPSLAFGGAERVVAKMAGYWAARGDAVTVVTLASSSGDTYALDPAVLRVALDLVRESRGPIPAIANNMGRVRKLRGAIAGSSPDAVISFTDRMNVLTLLACQPLKVDTVVSERIDPRDRRSAAPGPGSAVARIRMRGLWSSRRSAYEGR